MRRIGIFLLYDPAGIVDDYIPVFLKALKQHCEELVVVVNGELNPDGKRKLDEVCSNVILRPNVGYDSWAYKQAIELCGYEKLASYDELIICNYTCFGPMYPFSELFTEMSGRECDFWGVHRHVALPETSRFAGHIIGEHIQSHFIVFRNSILRSEHFKQYWQTLQPVTSYEEAIAFHELRCTPYFENLGYTSSSYITPQKYFLIEPEGNASVTCAFKQLVEDRSPLLKRKFFFLKGGVPQWRARDLDNNFEIIKYIRDNLNYDVRLIEQNISRTQDMDALPNKLRKNLTYFRHLITGNVLLWKRKRYLTKKKALYKATLTKAEYQNIWRQET